jgi:hypothetical protein
VLTEDDVGLLRRHHDSVRRGTTLTSGSSFYHTIRVLPDLQYERRCRDSRRITTTSSGIPDTRQDLKTQQNSKDHMLTDFICTTISEDPVCCCYISWALPPPLPEMRTSCPLWNVPFCYQMFYGNKTKRRTRIICAIDTWM